VSKLGIHIIPAAANMSLQYVGLVPCRGDLFPNSIWFLQCLV